MNGTNLLSYEHQIVNPANGNGHPGVHSTNWSRLATTNFSVLGGSPGAGKILTSDAGGAATWQSPESFVWAATTGGPGGTNLTVDFTALGATNNITFTFGTSNICVFPTNIVAGKTVKLSITQATAGFGTIGTNSGLTQLRLRIGSTVTGFNCTTNGGYIDDFSLYGVGTNAHLVGNVLGFAP